MDGHRFDDFTRLLAAGHPRRRVLRALGGSLAALVGWRTPVLAGCVGVKGDCESSTDCCSPLFCIAHLCLESDCLPPGEACVPDPTGEDLSCCGNLTCVDGVCVPEVFCSRPGDPCDDLDFQCCDDLPCIDGFCVDPDNPCTPFGQPCDATTPPCCGDQVCTDGTCLLVTCSFEGEPCTDDFACCDELICSEGLCTSPVCQAPGEPCDDVALTCCEGLHCADGTCAVVEPVCADAGEPCDDVSPRFCCGDLFCLNNTCAVICYSEGESCARGELPCCPGLGCTEDVCTPVDPECMPPVICEADSECCGGICCAGVCGMQACCVEDPDPNARCDDDQVCVDGFCAPVSCVQADGGCATDIECCDELLCRNGACRVADEGSDGGDSTDGTGGVTTLPDTGTAPRGTTPSAHIEITLAAGIAAWLAGRRLRAQDPDPGSAGASDGHEPH